MKMKYDDEINDKSLLLEEETIAAEDTISSMKQQHLVEVAHFQDIIDDLQRSDDLDCADKKLQFVNYIDLVIGYIAILKGKCFCNGL